MRVRVLMVMIVMVIMWGELKREVDGGGDVCVCFGCGGSGGDVCVCLGWGGQVISRSVMQPHVSSSSSHILRRRGSSKSSC